MTRDNKLLFAQALILLMLVAMFANIFITPESFGGVARGVVLVSFLVAGLLFIRNTIQEERQREELSQLTGRLEELNTNLESLVLQRTEEIDRERVHTNTIIEHLNQGILELSPSLAITRINTAAEEFLGVNRKEVAGRSFAQATATDIPAQNMRMVSFPYTTPSVECELPPPAELPKEADVREVRIEKPTLRDLQIVTVPLTHSEHGVGLVRVLRDITRAKLISQSKNEFVSIVAHQLRTPLTAAKWSLERISSGELGNTSKKQADRLTQITNTNDHLLELVGDLLLVSRIEADKVEHSTEEVNLTNIIRAALTRAKSLELAKELTITTSIPRKRIALQVDRGLLSKAIVTVLDNAVRYSEPGGKVTVTLANDDRGTLLSVINTGLSVPPSEFNQLFNKFYRSTEAIKRHTEGTGLSLFITKHIVEHYGGTITARPHTPSGLEVFVSFPSTS